MAAVIQVAKVQLLLSSLFDRPVQAKPINRFVPHPATLCGLVDDHDSLSGAVGADLGFAHRAGAALGLVPVSTANQAATNKPSANLIEYYREVANILTRVVNESTTKRVRIDPGLQFDRVLLANLAEKGNCQAFDIGIADYGFGQLGFWST